MFQMVVDCEADPECSLMLSSSVAAEHARDLRAILSTPAPQAQPDARAVEGEPVLTGISLEGQQGEPAGVMTVKAHLTDGSEVALIRDNGNIISHWKNMAGVRLSAPAADDGWRPTREEVARAINPVLANAVFDGPYAPRSAMGLALEAADRVLALHPAAPTDEVGKS